MHVSEDIVFKCCVSTMCSFYATSPSAGYFLVEVVHIEYGVGLLRHTLEMVNMEEKMDAVLSSIQALRQAQAESQDEVACKLA